MKGDSILDIAVAELLRGTWAEAYAMQMLVTTLVVIVVVPLCIVFLESRRPS